MLEQNISFLNKKLRNLEKYHTQKMLSAGSYGTFAKSIFSLVSKDRQKSL